MPDDWRNIAEKERKVFLSTGRENTHFKQCFRVIPLTCIR